MGLLQLKRVRESKRGEVARIEKGNNKERELVCGYTVRMDDQSQLQWLCSRCLHHEGQRMNDNRQPAARNSLEWAPDNAKVFARCTRSWPL